jgi:DNA (cytosine-5)-methyltransferase 1
VKDLSALAMEMDETVPWRNLLNLTKAEVLDRVDELLQARYRSASLGNQVDPLDELIYIVLSIQTSPSGYQRAFAELKRRFGSWDEILAIPEGELEGILKPAGLSKQKSRTLRRIVAAVASECRKRSGKRYRRANLNFLRSASDHAAEEFLTSLPGVSIKTARCVLMYSLGRSVFPVDTHVLRVLTRLGVADPDIHRKRAGDPVQALVPTQMRYRLHVNLIHHGRALCLPANPHCDRCPLISFCRSGIERLQHTARPRPTVDLFAGPGGLSAGFSSAGYTVVFAAERNRNAAQTYRYNHPGVPTLECDVANLTGEQILQLVGLKRGDIVAVLGGPPCQGYSQAGKRDPSHPDNHLYDHFVRVAMEMGAELALMENVPGIRNVRGRAFISDVEAAFRLRGFEPCHFLLNAAAYGVPQRRLRILFIGVPDAGPPIKALMPPPVTHCVMASTSSNPSKLPAARTVAEAFHGLPPRRSGQGSQLEMVGSLPLLNHVAMRHSRDVIDAIRSVPIGGGAISYRRLAAGEPARTIIAGHRALPVHPTQHRTITVREAARLQGFEDAFLFLGPRAEQPLQVANAVPPPLAQAIATWIATSVRPIIDQSAQNQPRSRRPDANGVAVLPVTPG